ncbi:hypothetical protein ACOSP7_020565 [Xanthoceras sorbifolium]|uniref:Uncharacterized protein n=1 Tax=Xanthoceras sorbifolium TaxID=99658 RepID=A0ABQ8HLG0_9ROSI|nr:hypothetical protein JRO89_XS09G0162000 [Xanthoceras sorbifolium]
MAMATNNNVKSEARRRRIQDAGSDRLALITGRIQTLPPSPRTPAYSTSHLHARNESTPAVFFSQHDHETPRTPFFDQNNDGLDDATTFKMLKRDSSLGYLKGNTFDIGNKVDTKLHKINTDREAMQAPAVDDTKPETLPAKSVVQDTLNDEKQLLLEPSKPNQNKLFSSKRIHYCIINSEGTRSFCALVIAVLVVLSSINYPLLNIVSSENIVASRPLYILLLTDVMIVVAHVYLENRRELEEAEAERMQSQEEGHNLVEAIVLMERGLVVYQIIRGVFIDFSIYAVVVICGFSLM